MIADFFLDKCNIYHLKESEQSQAYGIKATASHYSYDDTPDVENQDFHLGGIGQVTTDEPRTSYESRLKCGFPVDCDIRLNDKVKDLSTGFEYIAELPKKIRNHHIAVYLTRSDSKAVL